MDIKLESSELLVVPLTAGQLRLEREDSSAYAASLGYPDYTPEPPNSDLSDALLGMIESVSKAPHLWPWNTNWAIISKKRQVIIGGIDFHGPPQDGRVEIGYGIDLPYRHHGYLAQAVTLMCEWAFTHPEVSVIEAETDLENLASQRVLQRKGYQPYRVEGSHIWWRLPRE